MTGATVPSTVHANRDGDGRLVLLDAATGRWYVLNRTGAEFYAELRESGDIERAADALVSRHPTVPAQRIRGDIEELVSALVRRGLIELVDDVGRHAAGVPVALPGPDRPVPRRYRLAALLAFPMALVLLRLPFRICVALVGRWRRAKPEASTEQVLAALTAARRVSRDYPGRVACLELSLTAVLTVALLGRRADWCFGFAVDPRSFHAWVEVGGEPAVDPSDDPIPPTYQRVFRV